MNPMVSHVGLAMAFAGLFCCSPTVPAAVPSSSEPDTALSEQEIPLVYSKYTDPLFLAHGEEQNVFGRRTLARLWVAVASTDPAGEAQAARMREAQKALEETEHAVSLQTNACDARVDIALERAISTKNRLEQQYLETVERQGEHGSDAIGLDAQIHVLRDEVEVLTELAEPCSDLPDSST